MKLKSLDREAVCCLGQENKKVLWELIDWPRKAKAVFLTSRGPESHLLGRGWLIRLETNPYLHFKEKRAMPFESPGGFWKQVGTEPTCAMSL